MKPVSLFDGNHLKFYSVDNANSALMHMVGESVLLEANLNVSGSITADSLILVNGLNTDDITEGETHKYYTDQKVDDRISANVETTESIKGKLGITTLSGSNTGDQTLPTALSQLTADSTHGLVTDADKSNWNGKQNAGSYLLASDIAGKEDLSNKSIDIAGDGGSDTKYPSVKAIKNYADNLIGGLLNYRSGYNASGNAYPTSLTSTGSGVAGAIMKGDMWVISTAGTLGGSAIQIGDSIIANTNNPGQTAANWNTLNSNITYVPEDVARKVSSISGSSTDAQYPSAKLLYDQLATKQGTGAYLTGVVADSPLSGAGTAASHLTVDLSGRQVASVGLSSLAGLTYASTSFVKMTDANTFALDTNVYLTSLAGAVLTAQTTPQTIGNSSNRLTKLWATDLDVSNVIATGNIGVGISNPTGKLHFKAGSVAYGSGGLRLEQSADTHYWDIMPAYDQLYIGRDGATYYTFLEAFFALTDGGTNFIKLAKSGGSFFNGGNLGIGNANPGALLDLGLAGTKLGVIRLAGSTSGNVSLQPNVVAGTDIVLTLPSTSGTLVVGTPWTSAGYLTSLTGAILVSQATPQTIGATGSRLAKLWATDIESTNAITMGGIVVPTISSTNILTNKRKQPRVYTVNSVGASLTPEIATFDIFDVTAVSQPLTIANHSYSIPADGELMEIRLLDNGFARALSFGTNYVAKAGTALPTTTTLGKNMTMLFEWFASLGKWNLMSVGVGV